MHSFTYSPVYAQLYLLIYASTAPPNPLCMHSSTYLPVYAQHQLRSNSNSYCRKLERNNLPKDHISDTCLSTYKGNQKIIF
jgi:hypothetical protein